MHDNERGAKVVLKTSSMVLGAAMLVAFLLPLYGCGGSSSSFGPAPGNPETGAEQKQGDPPRITMHPGDLELMDPHSLYDGKAAPGEEVSFVLTIRNEGTHIGSVDVIGLNILPAGGLEILSRSVNGDPVSAFAGVEIPGGDTALLSGTARVNPNIQVPAKVVMGPPDIVPGSPPTDPETLVDPEDIQGSDTLTIGEEGEPPPIISEGTFHTRRPGSMLIFPFYRVFAEQAGEDPVKDTLITITNTNPDTTPLPSGLPAGTVDVTLTYIDGIDCKPFERKERLTPNDTFSVMVGLHIPYQTSSEGWIYATARDPESGVPIDFDHLIGFAAYFDALDTVWFEVNPLSFRAVPGAGLPTDLDGDGHLDLNGTEYEMAADEQLFPRFLGRFASPGKGGYRAELLLLNLTGGAQFDCSARFLLFNDNEQIWSTFFSFKCWDIVPLEDISNIFTNDFLKNTGHDPSEELSLFGGDDVETGWFRIDGDVAWNYDKAIDDPVLVCLLLEWNDDRLVAASPFGTGEKQNNATLWPQGPLGDNED